MTRRRIEVDYLARVEGEGRLDLEIADGHVAHCALSIFEPPRFFEAFLKGRHFTEAPDITARICGICPVAYQMSAVAAMENALGVVVDGPIRDLRRLLYCGEWIESHALHIYMLHAPDFLGYESAFALAKDDAATVERGLRLKRAGNRIVELLGGREIHPINVRVGGFYRLPAKADLASLRDDLARARDEALATVRWTAGFDCPETERAYAFVSIAGESEYPMLGARIVASSGLDIPVADFDRHFEEVQVPHSTALHAHLRGGGPYLCGPLARFALNADKLAPLARAAAREAGLAAPCRNPFRSIVVRAVEVLHAIETALALIDRYEAPDAPALPAEPRAAAGYGVSEAPRGLLYHRYAIDAEGTIREARIVPPTSQNQATIEEDVRRVAGAHLDLPDDALQWRCEQAIRNHDPCISCAAHFLKLAVSRR